MAAACIVLIGLWLWLSWENYKQANCQRLSVTAAFTAGQVQNYFDYLGEHLEGLAEELRPLEIPYQSEKAMKHLLHFKELHPELAGVSVVLPNGEVAAATFNHFSTPINILDDPAWVDDFSANLQTKGLTVNRPQIDHVSKKWLIPLRYTVRDGSGLPQYVIQASLYIENQQALWGHPALPQGVVIGVIRQDGFLISRLPNGDTPNLYRHKHTANELLLQIESGQQNSYFETLGIDGVRRYGAFQRLQKYPLYAFLAESRQSFLGGWWRTVQTPFYLLLALLALGAVFYAVLAQRFSKRMDLIRASLGNVEGVAQKSLPTSGVKEIDNLFDALMESRERLKGAAQNREKLLMGAAKAGTYAVRVSDQEVIAADSAFLAMLGRTEDEVVGQYWPKLMAGEDGTAAGQSNSQGLTQKVVRFDSAKVGQRWLSLAEYVNDEHGGAVRHGLAIDVSDREALLAQVKNQSARFQALWHLATSRSMSDEEKAHLMLSLARDMLNMDTAYIGELSGENFSIRYLVNGPDVLKVGETCPLEALCKEVVQKNHGVFIYDIQKHEFLKNIAAVNLLGLEVYAGIPIWVDEELFGTLAFLSFHALAGKEFSDDDKAFMELLANWFGLMLLRSKQREALQTQALTDTLTGLPNRRAAELRFIEEVARAKREGGGFSVAIADLDRFKLINDNFGHDVGDEVLRQSTHIMRQALREGDWIARWGGEEFILFLHQSSSAEAIAAVERIRLALKAHPLVTREGEVEVTSSFGIGGFQLGDDDISRTLSEADGCLYEAKRRGRDCVVSSDAGGTSTLWRAGMLQRALQEHRIVPAYQIMVDLRTGKVVADETLARLVQADGTVIPASEFIEAAEGMNLIHELDQVIGRQSMTRCSVALEEGFDPNFAHFINLSPQFLARKELVEEMLNFAMSICPCNVEFRSHKPIVFEITERQLLSNFEAMRRDVQPLLDFGFRLALDDFGSGYSSFLYLAELPISFLKIEGWMVQNMRSNRRIRHMVESMVNLAQRLDITTIAEFVEDVETAEILRDMGVDWGQGHYFGKPEL